MTRLGRLQQWRAHVPYKRHHCTISRTLSECAGRAGKWNGVGPPQLVHGSFNLAFLDPQGSFVLHPIIVMNTTLAVTLADPSGSARALPSMIPN